MPRRTVRRELAPFVRELDACISKLSPDVLRAALRRYVRGLSLAQRKALFVSFAAESDTRKPKTDGTQLLADIDEFVNRPSSRYGSGHFRIGAWAYFPD